MASSKPQVQAHASTVSAITRGAEARSCGRPGYASANATIETTSQREDSSPSKIHTSNHSEATVANGSTKASNPRNSRLWLKTAGPGSVGAGGGGADAGPRMRSASGIGRDPGELGDGLGTVAHVELAEDALHVVLHRELTDMQDAADLGVGLAHRDPHHDLALALGQLAQAHDELLDLVALGAG